MPRITLFITLFWVTLLLPYITKAQSQNRVVKDLRSIWKTYDESSGHLVPFINTEQNHAIYLEFDLSTYRQFDLELNIPPKHSIYINDQLVYLSNEHSVVVWSIDSLSERYQEPKVTLTLFSNNLNGNYIDVSIVKKSGDRSNQLESFLTFASRHNSFDMNILTLSSFVILSLIVIYRTTSYRLFKEYFSVSKAIMIRQRFDLIGAHSPFSPVTLGFVLLYALMIGATALNFKLINLWSLNHIGWLELSDDPLIYGFQMSCIAFVLMALKYPLILIVSGVFSFQKFRESHYFAYLRISLIALLILLATSIIISILSDQWVEIVWYICRFLVVILLMLRLSYMGIILNNRYNLSKLHLFTYLCSSEIIPICLLMKSL